MMNKEKTKKKLATLSWDGLDWLQEQCRQAKANANGPRTYRIDGYASSAQVAEAARDLSQHFEDVCYKHHGESIYDGMDRDLY